MHITMSATVAIAFTFMALTATPALSNALANMHTLKPVNGKLCMVNHPHYRESGTYRTKAQAQARVIRAWENYTRFEYGRAWARYDLSIKKNMTCVTGAGGTSCTLVAHPCRY